MLDIGSFFDPPILTRAAVSSPEIPRILSHHQHDQYPPPILSSSTMSTTHHAHHII